MSIFRYAIFLLVLFGLAACGGGGGAGGTPAGGSAIPPAASGSNVLSLAVDAGPPGTNNVNIPYVSVTVCVPGSAVCQTIDHVLVDTGSTGLRLFAPVLDGALLLPAQTDGSGNALAECAAFASGYSWGAVRRADVRLAELTASSLPVQIIADPAFPDTPVSCSSQGPIALDTVAGFSANGVLGVSSFVEDCGSACVSGAIPGTYYTCPPGGCLPVAVPLARQLQNPVARLPGDSNGVVIELPAIGPAGAATASGSLILGIGTRTNNALGNAAVLDLDASGLLGTVFAGQARFAFVDSGSNGLFFDSTLPLCADTSPTPGFYCPALAQNFAAVISGARNGTSVGVSFSVANAAVLVQNQPSFFAFANLAAPFDAVQGFDWGLPFFYGRRVFTAIEQRGTPAGSGPFIAF